jgi:predicted PurR-regulated permease PerM
VGAADLSLGAAFSGALTLGLSFAAFLIAIFSSLNRHIGRLADEHYATLLWSTVGQVRRFLSRAWWLGFSVSTLVAVLAGLSLYVFAEPFFQDVRQRQVLTKSDLDSLDSVSTQFRSISNRIEQIERKPAASVDDLEKVRAALEQEIQALKSGVK